MTVVANLKITITLIVKVLKRKRKTAANLYRIVSSNLNACHCFLIMNRKQKVLLSNCLCNNFNVNIYTSAQPTCVDENGQLLTTPPFPKVNDCTKFYQCSNGMRQNLWFINSFIFIIIGIYLSDLQ